MSEQDQTRANDDVTIHFTEAAPHAIVTKTARTITVEDSPGFPFADAKRLLLAMLNPHYPRNTRISDDIDTIVFTRDRAAFERRMGR